jgi:hypothetical protein
MRAEAGDQALVAGRPAERDDVGAGFSIAHDVEGRRTLSIEDGRIQRGPEQPGVAVRAGNRCSDLLQPVRCWCRPG